MNMQLKPYLIDTIACYEKTFGNDPSLDAFRLFINAHDNLTDRKINLAGQVTGSALVWHKPSNMILRVYHAKLNRWVFTAGGHIDDGEMPWQAASRELLEETGITAAPLFDLQNPMPLIMDAHPIPASVKKSEPAHWHYDIVYLYGVDEKPEVIADANEVTQFKWVHVSEVTPENAPVNLSERMARYFA